MSSVLRFFKQTPSNTFFGEATADFWSYETIQTYADGSGATFTSANVITFPTLEALQGCLNAMVLNPDDTTSQVGVRDMGKRLYMGVEGEDSEMVVFALGQVIQGDNQDNVVYFCVQDVTNTISVDIGRGAW